MSTDYRLEKKIPAADVLDGRLMAFGVREQMSENTTEASKCLTDGRNYIWFNIDDDGAVSCLSRYGGNVPSKILQAIATIFDTDIFSEYEPQFWGFDSQEEWDAAMMGKEADDRFYSELIKHLRGEPNDIKPGTIGAIQAKIAKNVTDENPQLVIPEMRGKLMAAVNDIYERDYAVTVTLTNEDIAYAKILGTHEDDMG